MADTLKKKKKPGFKLSELLATEPTKSELPKFNEKDITDKWTIKERIGSGAFKEAYKVLSRDSKDKKNYVMFQFLTSHHTQQGSDKTTEQKKEIDNFKKFITSTVKKGCSELVICPIEIGIYDGKLSLITNFFKGTSLTKYLESQCFNIDIALEIMIQMMRAIVYLHMDIGFIHFDIKPDNIQINVTKTKGVELGLIDIGSGCFKDEIIGKTCTPNGTAAYTPPEISEIGLDNFMETKIFYNWEKADVYSAGVIFGEIIDVVKNCSGMKLQLSPISPSVQIARRKSESKNETGIILSQLQYLQKTMTNKQFKKRPTAIGVLNSLIDLQKKQKSLSSRRKSLI